MVVIRGTVRRRCVRPAGRWPIGHSVIDRLRGRRRPRLRRHCSRRSPSRIASDVDAAAAIERGARGARRPGRPRSPFRRSRRRAGSTGVGASGDTRKRMSPGATSGEVAGLADLADGAQRLCRRALSSSKRWATAGAIASERWRRSQAPPAPSASAPLAAIRKRQRIARDQAFDRARGDLRAGPRRCARDARHWPRGCPIRPSQRQREPDRQQHGGQDQQQLGRGRQRGEALGGGHRARSDDRRAGRPGSV